MCILVAGGQIFAAKKVTWVIDPGHGGHDTGCENRSSKEKTITLAVAKELGKLIKKEISGVKVVFTREKDRYLTLQDRCDIANKRSAELFVSIHVNSASSSFARGTETFYATNVPMKGSQFGKSELLALLLQKQYLSHGREVSRGVKQRELYVCEHTNMPSVLTEVGFISNLNEEAYLTSKAGQKELAQAICKALKEWKDMTKKGTVSRQDLQRLRYSHYAPITMIPEPKQKPASTQPKATSGTTKPQKEINAAAITASVTTEKVKSGKAKDKKQETLNAGEQHPSTQSAPTDKPSFAIQLMNVAAKLKEGDYRLKGFKDVRYLADANRFKVLYGHSDQYQNIKNQLAVVRETFPEAFIVSFMGERQITTSEALQILKK
jgi:N-acetylmuramoyl-L-alanine amidase